MIRKRQQKNRHRHYCVLLNPKAARYDRKTVDEFIRQVRNTGGHYTVSEPRDAMELYRQARQAVGLQKRSRYFAESTTRRGPITALVACGGDGTFNLVARPALEADLPVGLIPMGDKNNIARSLLGSTNTDEAARKIISGNFRKIDSATASGQTFFGSIGIGFIAQLASLLEHRPTPRFGVGWARLGAQAAAEVPMEDSIIKVDAFRFEVHPLIFNVNLLTWSAGLPLSPVSVPDDAQAEVIFDHGDQMGSLGQFVRQIAARKYLYGDAIRLYRGTTITVQPVHGRRLYLDGELIEIPHNVLEVQIGQRQVKVFC